MSKDYAVSMSGEEQRLLDLLVDGELDESRRKAFLSSLDSKPDGWRRCALAFLEAQQWRGAMGSLVAESSQPAPPAAVDSNIVSAVSAHTHVQRTSNGRGANWGNQSLGWLATAASVLVAFTLGMALRGMYLGGPTGGATSLPAPDDFVQRQTVPHGEQDIVRQPALPRESSAADNVRLVVDGDGQRERMVEVPLVNDPAFARDFPFDQMESAIPGDVLRQLEALGHRVEHQRRIAPMQLRDGRRVVVPVEDVHIVPVRREAY